jgi:hypothetical protein
MNLQDISFKRNIGIELTFVPKVIHKKLDANPSHRGWEVIARIYKQNCKVLEPTLTGINKIAEDYGCVEYPSPILKSWEEVQSWWTRATRVADLTSLTSFHPKQEGGMGHIHIAVKQEEAVAIIADLAARPYLGWIFATPNGSAYCKSVLSSYITKGLNPGFSFPVKNEKLKRISVNYVNTNEPPLYTDYYWNDTVDENMKTVLEGPFMLKANRWIANDDRFMVACYRPTFGTLEWRAFDAAADWEIQEEHVAFLQHYIAVILEKQKQYPAVPFIKGMRRAAQRRTFSAMREQYRSNFDLCVQDYKALIVNTLGLPWNRYEWYIDRNLKPAFEWGKKL